MSQYFVKGKSFRGVNLEDTLDERL
jgi:hypothetical protein